MKGHSSVHEIVWLICCLFCNVKSVPEQEANNWVTQCGDIKRILIGLDSKMGPFTKKLTELNVLDYALQITNIDDKFNTLDTSIEALKVDTKAQVGKISALEQNMQNLVSRSDQHWEALNTRLDQMSVTVESVLGAIKKLTPEENLTPSDNKSEELMKKLDDYGSKLVEFNQHIQEDVKQNRQEISGFLDVVNDNFSKVISKVDKALEMEDQITSVISVLPQMSDKTTSIAKEIVILFGEFSQVKGDVTASHKLLTNINLNLNKSTENTESFPVADLTKAMEITKEMESQLTSLAALQEKIVEALALSSQLLFKSKEAEFSDFETVALNLSTFLNEIQQMSLPLFASVPDSFHNFQAYLGDALTFMRNKTQCHSNQVVQLEVQRLKSTMQQVIDELRNSSNGAAEGFKRRDMSSIKNYMLQTMADLREALREVNLKHLFWNEEEERKQVEVDCSTPIVTQFHEKVGSFPDDILIGFIGSICEIGYLALSVF